MNVIELKVECIYEFVGETNIELGYIKGREYNLDIIHRSWLSRVLGVFWSIPYQWTVIIMKPFACPYESMDAFYANWKYKRMSISG